MVFSMGFIIHGGVVGWLRLNFLTGRNLRRTEFSSSFTRGMFERVRKDCRLRFDNERCGKLKFTRRL